jgi:dihydrodipicolinate synthase/N-acetylneuraminate lyase
MIPPLTRETLRGVWPALLTPWTEDDELDEHRFAAEIRAYGGVGVHGVYTGGTTGEFYAQDDETFRRITEIACREGCAAGLPVQIGCTALSTRNVRRRIAVAVEAGASGVQLAVPFWLELSDAEIIDFFLAAANAAGSTPLILYNTSRAKRKIGPELLSRLIDAVPNLIGMKDTGCTLDELRAMLAAAPGLAIFGAEHDLARKMAIGGRGTYSSIAGLNAQRVVALYELSAANRFDDALLLEDELRRYTFELLVPMVQEGLWDSAVDRVQRIAGGVNVGLQCQGPYRSATQEHIERLQAWCRVHAPQLLVRRSASSLVQTQKQHPEW